MLKFIIENFSFEKAMKKENLDVTVGNFQNCREYSRLNALLSKAVLTLLLDISNFEKIRGCWHAKDGHGAIELHM